MNQIVKFTIAPEWALPFFTNCIIRLLGRTIHLCWLICWRSVLQSLNVTLSCHGCLADLIFTLVSGSTLPTTNAPKALSSSPFRPSHSLCRFAYQHFLFFSIIDKVSVTWFALFARHKTIIFMGRLKRWKNELAGKPVNFGVPGSLAPGMAAPESTDAHGLGRQVHVLNRHGNGANLLPLRKFFRVTLHSYQKDLLVVHLWKIKIY